MQAISLVIIVTGGVLLIGVGLLMAAGLTSSRVFSIQQPDTSAEQGGEISTGIGMMLVGRLVVFLVGLGMAIPLPALARSNTAARTAAITNLLLRQQAVTHIPGIAVIVRQKGAIIYQRAIGVDGNGAAFTTETPVWLGSISKSFTALAVAQLAASGRLDLDAPVVRYLPDFRPSTPEALKITVRNLLEQTSGLTDRNSPDWVHPWPHNLTEVTARLSSVTRLASAPGTHHAYHNANYMLLGDVVEHVSGEKYSAYLAQHVFTPLGMRSARAVNLMNEADDVPPGHVFLFGRPFPEHVAGMFVGGAGGVIASASDLDRWVEAFARASQDGHAGVIPKMQIDQMLHPATAAPYLYRFGWVVRQPGTTLIRHNGGLPTFVAHAAFSPDGALSIVIVTNASLANPAWSEVGEDLADGVADILAGRPPKSIDSQQIGPTVEIAFTVFAAVVTGLGLYFSRPRRWRRISSKLSQKAAWQLWLRAMALPGLMISCVLVILPAAFSLVESWSWYWLWYLTPAVAASLWTIALGFGLALLLRAYGLETARSHAATQV